MYRQDQTVHHLRPAGPLDLIRARIQASTALAPGKAPEDREKVLLKVRGAGCGHQTAGATGPT